MILNMELYQYSKNFLEDSENQDSDERFKMNNFTTESSARSERISTEISTVGIKPVVTEKHQFERRSESN